MAAPNPKDVSDLNKLLREQSDNLSNVNKKQQLAQTLAQERATIEKAIADWGKEYAENQDEATAAIKELNTQLDEVLAEEKKINTQLERGVKTRKITNDLARTLSSQLKTGWKYLQEQDKLIKQTNLSLGMSSSKAVAMRDAFEKSAKIPI